MGNFSYWLHSPAINDIIYWQWQTFVDASRQQEDHEFRVNLGHIQRSGAGGRIWGRKIWREGRKGTRKGNQKWRIKPCMGTLMSILTERSQENITALADYRIKYQKGESYFYLEKVHPVTCYHCQWQTQEKIYFWSTIWWQLLPTCSPSTLLLWHS